MPSHSVLSRSHTTHLMLRVACSAAAWRTCSSASIVGSGARRDQHALATDEAHQRLDGAEVVEIQIFVVDLDVECLLQEQHQLHREQRVHETESENVLVVA